MNQAIALHLQEHSVYPWYKNDEGLFRGYVYDDEDRFLINEEAWQFINRALNDKRQFINGVFLFVRFYQEECVMLSDWGRSFTMLFGFKNHQWHIGDDGWNLAEKLELRKDEIQAFHFEAFSFCPDHSTPWLGLSQMQANERVVLKANGEVSLTDFATLPKFNLNFEQANTRMVNRLLSKKIEGKYVVPLSGGWDSRQLLCSLILSGVQNIIAYTYGNEESSEVKIAASIAKELNVEWFFVSYTPDLIRQLFGGKGRDFLHYASQGISSPQEQEFFALLELTRRGVIRKGDVLLPGYCGDLPAGSYVLTDVNAQSKVNTRTIKRWIRDRHLAFARGSGVEDLLLTKIYANLEPSQDATFEDWNRGHERWFIKEKVSKYVLNGLRTFEYFGIEWRLPLWDVEWLAYCYGCHFEQRQNRSHFKRQANRFLFQPLGVPHVINDNPVSWKSRLKSMLKDWIPAQWMQQWAKLRIKKADLDNTNGRHLVAILKKETTVQANWADESVNPYLAAYIWKLLG